MKLKRQNPVKRMLMLLCFVMLLVSAVCPGNTLTVQAAKVEKITLNKKSMTVTAGESKRLVVKVSPAGAGTGRVTWGTSNSKIAKVKNGVVTGISAGIATITAQTGGKKASCKVRVALGGKAKEAVNAYQRYLRQPRIRWTKTTSYGKEQFRFALADITGDGIPELMLWNQGGAAHFEGYEAVYGYYNGQVKEIVRDDAIKCYYPKKSIVVISHNGSDARDSYCKISSKGNVKELGSAPKGAYASNTSYRWGRKTVTKTEFNRLVKTNAGKNPVAVRAGDWNRNTSANRQKMEKLVKR